MPRQIRYSVVQTLDGFIATESGGYDWIPPSPEMDMTQFLERIDTIIMGRKTFETTRSTDEGKAMFEKGGMFYGFDVYVVSNTLKTVPNYAKVVKPDILETALAELKRQQNKKDIWLFGGGELFRSVMQMDMVDRVEVAVAPVLLGAGIPLLKPEGLDDKTIQLKFHSVESFDPSGMVLLKYEVQNKPQKAT